MSGELYPKEFDECIAASEREPLDASFQVCEIQECADEWELESLTTDAQRLLQVCCRSFELACGGDASSEEIRAYVGGLKGSLGERRSSLRFFLLSCLPLFYNEDQAMIADELSARLLEDLELILHPDGERSQEEITNLRRAVEVLPDHISAPLLAALKAHFEASLAAELQTSAPPNPLAPTPGVPSPSASSAAARAPAPLEALVRYQSLEPQFDGYKAQPETGSERALELLAAEGEINRAWAAQLEGLAPAEREAHRESLIGDGRFLSRGSLHIFGWWRDQARYQEVVDTFQEQVAELELCALRHASHPRVFEVMVNNALGAFLDSGEAAHITLAVELVERLESVLSWESSEPTYQLACLFARAGITDRALALVERALREGESAEMIRGDSDFASLTNDPRFQALLDPSAARAVGTPATAQPASKSERAPTTHTAQGEPQAEPIKPWRAPRPKSAPLDRALSDQELKSLNELLADFKAVDPKEVLGLCEALLNQEQPLSDEARDAVLAELRRGDPHTLSASDWLRAHCERKNERGYTRVLDEPSLQLIIATLLIRSGAWASLEHLTLDNTSQVRLAALALYPLPKLRALTLYEWRAEDVEAFATLSALEEVSLQTPSTLAEELIALAEAIIAKAPKIRSIEIPWVDPESLLALAARPEIFERVERGCAAYPKDDFLEAYTRSALIQARAQLDDALRARVIELGARICRFRLSTLGEAPFREVYCPPGEFTMGDQSREDEAASPPHRVRISHGLWISQLPLSVNVINKLFKTREDSWLGSSDRVCTVFSWINSVKLSNQLSEAAGLTPAYTIQTKHRFPEEINLKASGYRMLTEAEWEYAAQWGDPQTYSGSAHPHLVARFIDSNLERPQGTYGACENHDGRTGEDVIARCASWPLVRENLGCATLRANALGIYDMSGLIAEWCNDQHVKEAYAQRARREAVTVDPLIYPGGTYKKRLPFGHNMTYYVSRGGGCNYSEFASKIVHRKEDFPTTRQTHDNGLRLCRIATAH